jgi:phosphosulfolactate synthase (CoM biosynthesis protein A)
MTEKAPAKHLFLDLEGTVITPIPNGWDTWELLDTSCVKAFIDTYKPDSVHLFSFAIYDGLDASSFNWHVRDKLEKSLGVKIEIVPTLDGGIKSAFCKAKKVEEDRVERGDLMRLIGKQDAFRSFVRTIFQKTEAGTEVVLIDDDVVNEVFCFPDQNLGGRVINIQNILN